MTNSQDRYGEYEGGYNEQFPPYWVRPFIDNFDLEFVECGYIHGKWVEVAKEEETYTIRREINGDITCRAYKLVKVNESLPSETHKRDIKIKQIVEDRLRQLDSFEDLFRHKSSSD